MTLNILREGYEKTAGFLMLLETLFMLAISALAVIISAEEINAGADDGMSYYLFALSFIVGVFLIVFSLLAGLYGFFSKSEPSAVVIKIVGLFDVIISGMFAGDLIYVFIKDPTIGGDTYYQIICGISLAVGILGFLYACGAMTFSFLSSRYHDKFDGKKVAKELPDITKARFKEINDSIVLISAAVFSALTFAMSYYMCYQIKMDNLRDEIPVQWQAVLLNIIVVIAVIAAAVMLVAAVIKLAAGKKLEGKKKIINISSVVAMMSVLLCIAADTITLITLIGKDCFVDEDPIYYIIFNFVLIVITLPMIISQFVAVLPLLKQN